MILAEMDQVCSYRMNRKQNNVVALRLQAVNWDGRVLFTDLYRICSLVIELPSWGAGVGEYPASLMSQHGIGSACILYSFLEMSWKWTFLFQGEVLGF